MSIEDIIPLIEEVVKQCYSEIPYSEYYSHRHALEIHALGVVHHFNSTESRYLHVCLSIVISTAISHEIWIRILWKRDQIEFPREEREQWKFPLSADGLAAFQAYWPTIRQCMENAIERREPPKQA